jgi:hypothetical protein
VGTGVGAAVPGGGGADVGEKVGAGVGATVDAMGVGVIVVGVNVDGTGVELGAVVVSTVVTVTFRSAGLTSDIAAAPSLEYSEKLPPDFVNCNENKFSLCLRSLLL